MVFCNTRRCPRYLTDDDKLACSLVTIAVQRRAADPSIAYSIMLTIDCHVLEVVLQS